MADSRDGTTMVDNQDRLGLRERQAELGRVWSIFEIGWSRLTGETGRRLI